MKLPIPISFEWDANNKDKNWQKHTILYKEIEEVFFNRPVKFYADLRHSVVEKRYVALGQSDRAVKLCVIFTIRNNRIRVVSARMQSKKERRSYEK